MRVGLGIGSLFCFTWLASAAPPEKLPPDHAAKMTASAKLFAEKIRPFFQANCLECHGANGKVKGGFNLSTRETMLEESDRGKAVIPGKAAASDLVKYVKREAEPHMPPKKPVNASEIAALVEWIDLGAAYDRPLIESASQAKPPLQVSEKDKQYWAYRPLREVQVPSVQAREWPRNAVDHFILTKLEEKGIPPASDLTKAQLLRRVTFDLTGLPPTLEEQAAFLRDTSPSAYEKVVDRLLNSPHYGERWARHWLDPARFAESHGFEHDYTRPYAYHYRDFVIRAFNSDMPYNQFVQWQIAGDELAPNNPEALAATGFLGAGVYPTQITTSEAERIRYDAMDDMLATTGHTFLALTVGCARCHDHKYDPIPTRDYYRMLSAFTTTVRSEIEVDLGTPEEQKATAEHEAKLKPLTQELGNYEAKQLPRELQKWLKELQDQNKPLPKIADNNAAKGLQSLHDSKLNWDQLPKPQRDALIKWFGPLDEGWKQRQAKIADLEKHRPKNTKVKMQITSEGVKPMRHHTAVGEIPDFYPVTYQLKRGDPTQKVSPVSLGFLQVLSNDAESRWIQTPPSGARTSFRRASLAKFLTDTEKGAGALAARVIVNRLWHHHFGRGLVSTLNDFGFQGDTPTHPELLEWLANDLSKHWSLKRLHKLLVMSRVYQLSSQPSDSGKSLDPDNKLWHHVPRRRLEAEAIRDSMLAVSGLLDRTMFGPGTLDEGMTRRSIYFQVKRSQLIPMLQVFDWPDTLTSSAARPTTTVAPQALLFLNNPHVRGYAASLGQRLQVLGSHEAAIKQGYQLCFGREPNQQELAAGLEFLKNRPTARAFHDYALALMSLNEFIYLD